MCVYMHLNNPNGRKHNICARIKVYLFAFIIYEFGWFFVITDHTQTHILFFYVKQINPNTHTHTYGTISLFIGGITVECTLTSVYKLCICFYVGPTIS